MHIAIKKGGTPIWYHYLRSSLCIHMCVCVRAKGGVMGWPFDASKCVAKGWGFCLCFSIVWPFAWVGILTVWLALLIASAFLFDCLSYAYVFI